jgi:hypothetical protein
MVEFFMELLLEVCRSSVESLARFIAAYFIHCLMLNKHPVICSNVAAPIIVSMRSDVR